MKPVSGTMPPGRSMPARRTPNWGAPATNTGMPPWLRSQSRISSDGTPSCLCPLGSNPEGSSLGVTVAQTVAEVLPRAVADSRAPAVREPFAVVAADGALDIWAHGPSAKVTRRGWEVVVSGAMTAARSSTSSCSSCSSLTYGKP